MEKILNVILECCLTPSMIFYLSLPVQFPSRAPYSRPKEQLVLVHQNVGATFFSACPYECTLSLSLKDFKDPALTLCTEGALDLIIIT